MSKNDLKNDLERIQTAKGNIKQSLENKGKTVTNNIEDYSSVINNIEELKGQEMLITLPDHNTTDSYYIYDDADIRDDDGNIIDPMSDLRGSYSVKPEEGFNGITKIKVQLPETPETPEYYGNEGIEAKWAYPSDILRGKAAYTRNGDETMITYGEMREADEIYATMYSPNGDSDSATAVKIFNHNDEGATPSYEELKYYGYYSDNDWDRDKDIYTKLTRFTDEERNMTSEELKEIYPDFQEGYAVYIDPETGRIYGMVPYDKAEYNDSSSEPDTNWDSDNWIKWHEYRNGTPAFDFYRPTNNNFEPEIYGRNTEVHLIVEKNAIAEKEGLTPDKLLKGTECLGIAGNLEVPDLSGVQDILDDLLGRT